MIASLLVVAFLYQWLQICIGLGLHRPVAHRAYDVHPVLFHIFRFSLWCTHRIMEPNNWMQRYAAKHRIHHLYSDTKRDFQSPRNFTLKQLFDMSGFDPSGANYISPEDIQKFAPDIKTPNSWIDRNLYQKYPRLGRGFTYIALFLWLGPWAILPIAFILHSGYISTFVFNIAPHLNKFGYKHPEQTKILQDDTTNLMPWSILHIGDDLHQNHHMYPSSPSYRVKWWEFDLGHVYVLIFSWFGLIKNIQPTPMSGRATKWVRPNN